MFFCFETMKMIMLLTKNENIRGGIGLVFIVFFFFVFFFHEVEEWTGPIPNLN